MASLPEPAEKMQLPIPKVGPTVSPFSWEGQLRNEPSLRTNVSPEVRGTGEALLPPTQPRPGDPVYQGLFDLAGRRRLAVPLPRACKVPGSTLASAAIRHQDGCLVTLQKEQTAANGCWANLLP